MPRFTRYRGANCTGTGPVALAELGETNKAAGWRATHAGGRGTGSVCGRLYGDCGSIRIAVRTPVNGEAVTS